MKKNSLTNVLTRQTKKLKEWGKEPFGGIKKPYEDEKTDIFIPFFFLMSLYALFCEVEESSSFVCDPFGWVIGWAPLLYIHNQPFLSTPCGPPRAMIIMGEVWGQKI